MAALFYGAIVLVVSLLIWLVIHRTRNKKGLLWRLARIALRALIELVSAFPF